MSPRVILVLSDPPLPFGSATARWYYTLLKGLRERGYRVTAFAACASRGGADEARRLFPAPEYDLRCFEHSRQRGIHSRGATLLRPYSYIFSGELRRALAAELEAGYDVLHLESLWTGWLGARHAARAVVNVHNLLSIDVAGAPATSATERLRALNARRAERHLLRRLPTFSVLTPRLADQVRARNPAARVFTVPLGIDLALYPFAEHPARPVAPVVGLIGSFNWYPTYTAATRLITRLWPAIRRQIPDATLRIVGRDARKRLGEFAGEPGVEIHEDVPDILPYFRDLDLLLYAPAQGSGMKVKVMEAFALGVPVVTTADGVEGLDARDGVHAGIADDDHGLNERAVALLRDPARARLHARNARALLERCCAPAPVLDAVEAMYAAMLESRT